jgi:hypothetical protein
MKKKNDPKQRACGVSIDLPLYGKPGWELDEGTTPSAQQLREHGQALLKLMDNAADAVERLMAAGWTVEVSLYDLSFHPPEGITTAAEVKEVLVRAGLDAAAFSIVELDE